MCRYVDIWITPAADVFCSRDSNVLGVPLLATQGGSDGRRLSIGNGDVRICVMETERGGVQ